MIEQGIEHQFNWFTKVYMYMYLYKCLNIAEKYILTTIVLAADIVNERTQTKQNSRQ